jgi:hypothetical protein
MSDLTADVLFGVIGERISTDGPRMVKRVGGAFRFIVDVASGGGAEGKKVWVVDLSSGDGTMTAGDAVSS